MTDDNARRETISQIHIEGFRVLRDISLSLDGLTVLIGDNGTGKSTLLDTFELLRQIAKPQLRLHDILAPHGGLHEMLSYGARHLKVEVTVGREEVGRLVYRLTLGMEGGSALIVDEALDLYGEGGHQEPLHVLQREGTKVRVFDNDKRRIEAPPLSIPLSLPSRTSASWRIPRSSV